MNLKDNLLNAISSIKDPHLLEKEIGSLLTNFAINISNVIETHHSEFLDQNIDNQSYPDGTKYIFNSKNKIYLVVENTPKVKTISVDTSYHMSSIGSHRYSIQPEINKFRIALPYVIYMLSLQKKDGKFYGSNLKIAFRTKPIKNINDELFMCILPHTHHNGNICTEFSYNGFSTIIDAFNDVLGYYWQSIFKYCLHHSIPNDLKTWKNWEEKTKSDPLFVLNVNWYSMNKTIKDFIDFNPEYDFQLMSKSIIRQMKFFLQ